MSSVSRYSDLLTKGGWLAVVASIAASLFLGQSYRRVSVHVSARAGDGQSAESLEWPLSETQAPRDWSSFRNEESHKSAEGGVLARRYRLAGTFFSYDGERNDVRKAILDDLENQSQFVLSESEPLPDASVILVKIFNDHVILNGENGEESLWLGFNGPVKMGVDQGAGTGTVEAAGAEEFEGTDRFGGRQIGKHRWIFKRDSLMQYYGELRDQPERLVRVFDSLKPVYTEEHVITGYALGIEGEADFFKSVGLQEGDVVKSVNSMAMTNRRRAEHFIKEFVNNRANAFVIEVERGASIEKQTYEVR